MENEHPEFIEGQGYRFETEHSMLRRMQTHDYQSRSIYMLTLTVEGRLPLLGTLRYEPGREAEAYVEPTPLGLAVQQCWESIPKFHPEVAVLAFQLMPDHIHGLLFVRTDMARHLGHVVNGFKVGCNRAVPFSEAVPPSTKLALPSSTKQPLPSSTRLGKLFAHGYQDSVLKGKDQLLHMFRYIADNPRRLAIKRQCRQWFTVQRGVLVAGRSCQLFGNRALLANPNKVAVIVHRRYTAADNARLREQWLACGANGGVLVSAGISPAEKAILNEAFERGYRIIQLLENGFPELYKPTGQSFDSCASGSLLQISPYDYHTDHRVVSRAQCLDLNSLVEAICGHV